jgi:hypothetical protein
MDCRICGEKTNKIFNALLLKKYDVDYFQCSTCGFAQTETPYWLQEAYVSPMNLSDTGVLVRCDRMSKITTTLITCFFNRKGKFLDYAGGLGTFTRAMRDIGFDYYWHDPFTKNELARGFEGSLDQRYGVVTTFESFEHFEHPLEEIRKILNLTDTIICSTDVVSVPAPKHKEWWYYASEHGQHIAFHSTQSFKTIARKLGLEYYNIKNIHILTRKKLNIVARLFLSIGFAKYLLYIGFFFINPWLKSKTSEDMNSFYS